MTMFDWQTSGQVVSSRFWIYWAVSVPLTALLMGGLYFWYRFAVNEIERDTHHGRPQQAAQAAN